MHIKFIRTVLLGLVLSVVCSAYGQKQEVHILAVNDMHATIEAFPKLAAIADSLRKLYPSLLVFSAGDNRTGNPLNDMYEVSSYPMVSLMNQVGFNATAVGNHEFDVKSLAPLMGYSNFSYICANMFPSPEAGLNIVPTKVFDVNGIKVGEGNGAASNFLMTLLGGLLMVAVLIIGVAYLITIVCSIGKEI